MKVEHLLRELAPQVLGALIRRARDFAAAEDAVQEALLAAATEWPRVGLPENPLGWLIRGSFASTLNCLFTILTRSTLCFG